MPGSWALMPWSRLGLVGQRFGLGINLMCSDSKHHLHTRNCSKCNSGLLSVVFSKAVFCCNNDVSFVGPIPTVPSVTRFVVVVVVVGVVDIDAQAVRDSTVGNTW